jgi:hypothetical protein
MKKKDYQQGDVLFKSIEKVKGKEVKPDARGYVFAEGETTGHCHVITETEAVKVYVENGVKHVRVIKASATVEHQEHGPVILPKGDYQIGIVKEYDPFENDIRRVQD